jgi:stage V sporulation protein B
MTDVGVVSRAGSTRTRPSLGAATVTLLAARLTAVASTFLAGVVAARLLDPAELGRAGVALSLGWAVAVVANGGLNIAAVSFLGSAGRRQVRPAAVVAYVLALAVLAALVGLALTGVLAPLVGIAVGLAGFGGQSLALFAATAVVATATIGYEVVGAVLLGLERRRAYIVADVLRSGATLALTVVVLGWMTRSAPGYVLATGLGVAAPVVVGIVVVRRVTGTVRPRFDRDFSRAALKLGLAGQLGNVLTFASLRLDLFLVAALLRLDLAGVYFVVTRVAEVVGQASTAAATMLFPHVAAQPDRQSTAATERACRLTVLATLAVGGVLAGTSPWLLTWLFGDVYGVGVPALSILLVAMVPLALTRVLAADLKGRGRPGLVSVAAGVGALVTVLGDLALIPVLGIEGAAAASVLAYSGGALVLLGSYRRVTRASLLALVPRSGDLREGPELVRAMGRRATRARSRTQARNGRPA